jgi:hypothetical protein
MNDVQIALKKRYAHLHPLLFQRSLEKAKSDVELFDILSRIGEYPIIWDEDERTWKKTDLLQVPRTKGK